MKATKFTKAAVNIDVVLEGINCVNYDSLPTNITFNQMVITDRDGKTISPSFTGTVNRAAWPADTKFYPDLSVDTSTAGQVTLST